VALLGSNGAGKSTTLKAISGLLRAEEGEVTDGAIELDGKRIESLDPEQIVRRGIFQVMEGRRVFEDLTVDENLTMGGYTRRDFAGLKRDRELCFDYFPRLRERRRQIAGYLSGGEQQMLAISRALMARRRRGQEELQGGEVVPAPQEVAVVRPGRILDPALEQETPADRERRLQRRLLETVAHAGANSAYFRRTLPERVERLEQIPITRKD